MTVFRVEKSRNYTVMSNEHLRNREMSLKAKGLLSQMLSLPDTWDYSLEGLSRINREGIDAIRTAIQELERFGYLERKRVRDAQGRLTGTEYIVHERSVKRYARRRASALDRAGEAPTVDNSTQGADPQAIPALGNPLQSNKDRASKDRSSNQRQSRSAASSLPDGYACLAEEVL